MNEYEEKIHKVIADMEEKGDEVTGIFAVIWGKNCARMERSGVSNANLMLMLDIEKARIINSYLKIMEEYEEIKKEQEADMPGGMPEAPI